MFGSCLTFGGFPNKFSKCCFHRCGRSSWLVTFSLVIFLLLTSFTVCHAILDCLSLTKFLILLIWFWMYSVCSFRYMLVDSFCAFLSFKALILVGFLLYHLEVVFTSVRFFLTANVSYGTLGWALNLVGMQNNVFHGTLGWALCFVGIYIDQNIIKVSKIHGKCWFGIDWQQKGNVLKCKRYPTKLWSLSRIP